MKNASKQDDPELQIRTVALRLLARREHSRLELATKLRQRRLPSGLIEAVLDEFEGEGWLSDERYADVYARQRMDAGYGPVRIRSELQQRGIRFLPESLTAVENADWAERAVRLRERRFGLQALGQDWKEKARQARFLTQRGFAAEHVERALEITTPDDG
ncbi:MAG: regulatory protein RecX [Marinobacter sp.]|uniref:regulatory protein RecX n=1 Tax=Marinobacter sp. TaxID=50741 RepID=UPI00299D6D7D|nr:regulatory protein RecX [Marinobacter sp.]MDX1754766.1 regulatory protein RecX [Marinobacter sp.]